MKIPSFLKKTATAPFMLITGGVQAGARMVSSIRTRLNHWNWRQKTALLTALTFTAGGVFYQNRAHAIVPLLPAFFKASLGEFVVKFAISYLANRELNAAFAKKVQATADAEVDGEILYSNREYYERNSNGRQIDADAEALFHKAYETRGTDSSLDPTQLSQSEVLSEVSHNANLNGYEETYEILEQQSDDTWEPLETWTQTNPTRYKQTHTIYWGGYVLKPTEAEIQEELDYFRDQWNGDIRRGRRSPRQQPHRILGHPKERRP